MKADAQAKSKAGEAPNNHKTRIDDAYRKIKQLIFEQKFVPGQKLVYDDLARLLNMSRTPVINALNRLEQQGLVLSESHRGFYVRPMDLGEAWNSFGLREALETYTVEQAILKAEESDFRELEEKLLDYDSYTPGYYDRKKIFKDASFHIQIAAMTRNWILKWHLRINFEHLYLRAKLDNLDISRMEKESSEHHLLLRKMRNKDIAGSIETIRAHIHGARSSVMACLSDHDLKSGGFEL